MTLTLTTVPLPALDAAAHPNRCLVSLDTLATLGLGLLDPVLVAAGGRSQVAAKLWITPSATNSAVALSSDLLQSLHLCVGDKVTLAPIPLAPPPPATALTLEPPPGVSIVGPALAYVRNHLLDMHLVSVKQHITLSLGGSPTTCRISHVSASSSPSPPVFTFTASTTLSIASPTTQPPNPSAPHTPAAIPLAGLDSTLHNLRALLSASLFHSHTYTSLHLRPPRGVLLYGPPGTGKTLLARHLAQSTQAHFTLVNGPELVSKFYGETEGRLRGVFETARANAPAVVFVDEMDALCPKREGTGSELDKRVVATLLTLLDGGGCTGTADAWDRVFVIGATNRPNAIDEAMRRPGRLDVEMEVGIPSPSDRAKILAAVLGPTRHSVTPQEITALANKMHGYVGADVASVVREAGVRAVRRRVELQDDLVISMEDLAEAMQGIVPSAMRESVVQVPEVRWEDIGGNEHIKQALKESVEWPLKRAHDFIRFGITPPKGILLYGPPGCSKTLVAKALANESQLNFLAVKGPELFSKWVGDSEKAIAQVFRKARAAAPSIIFFDEIDAIAGKRGVGGDGGGQSVTDRVLSQLLNEMDGVEPLVNVTIVAATNRPDLIDPALLRPGRIDRILYVGPPGLAARREILGIQARKMRVSPEVNLDRVAQELEGCSGAEVVNVCQAAALHALQRDVGAHQVEPRDFHEAVRKLARRITKEMVEFYEGYRMGSRLVSIA